MQKDVPLPIPSVVSLDLSSFDCKAVGATLSEDSKTIFADQKYYISIAPMLDYTHQFFWAFSLTEGGSSDNFLWRDTKDVFGYGKCPSWSDGTTCGLPTYGTELCFRLSGYDVPTTDADQDRINTEKTGNGGDGIVGDDVRESGAWSAEKQALEDEAIKVLRANSLSIVQTMSNEEQKVTDLPPEGEDEESEETPAWVIPIAVIFSLFCIAVIVVAVISMRRDRARREERF